MNVSMPPDQWFPLMLSLRVSLVATVATIAIGVPVAWLLARGRLPFSRLLSVLVLLPMVLPPSVVGYYLLLLMGRQSWLGTLVDRFFQATLVFTPTAAVIASAVMAMPLMIRPVQTAFEGVDRELEDAGRVFGASEWRLFWHVTLPLSWQGIVAGTALAFSRAIGEFGATLMVAGNIPGRTQTLPISIYDAVQSGNDELARTLSMVISVVTVVILLAMGRMANRSGW